MPIRFLSPEQRAKYEEFSVEDASGPPGAEFFLDDNDKRIILSRHGDSHRLGYALQLCSVRHLGYFVSDLGKVPSGIARHVGRQLGIEGSDDILLKNRSVLTHKRHVASIRNYYGYHGFSEQPWNFRFVRWLYRRAWLTPERPSVLFEKSCEYLKAHRILLPGISTLARVIHHPREEACRKKPVSGV